MEEFEQRLRRLSLREPSPELDRRVAQALAAAPVVELARPRRAVSWPWALAAALLMGVLGFLAGRLGGPAGGPPPTAATLPTAAPAVTVHVIYEGNAANPFDCTVAADDGLRPVRDIQIRSNDKLPAGV